MDQALRDSILDDLASSLMSYGTVHDQEEGEYISFSPYRIAPEFTIPALAFLSDPPRTVDGHRKWSVWCSSRQIGKSVTLALGMYVATGFNPGTTGGIVSDKQERSDALFKAINDCHNHWPKTIRPRTAKSNEKTQLSFVDEHGRPAGSLQTYSARSDNLGIGRSWDYTMLSEVPFWPNARKVWYALRPALTNRKNALVGFESTPAPMSEPSAEFYRDMCLSARSGHPRFEFMFTPFYKSRLNERKWMDDWVVTQEEIKLLHRFGPKGNEKVSNPGAGYLTLENLAFRRRTLEEDPEIKRNPQMFWVFYPLDPVSCWQFRGTGVIPQHALNEIADQLHHPWAPDSEGMQIYDAPTPQAQYVIGVDPAGFGTGDCAAFVVLEVWADKWYQVAEFSSRTADPQQVARIICEVAKLYNDADVIVEANGVGAGTLSLLDLAANNYVMLPSKLGAMKEYHLRHLWYSDVGKPGIPASKQRNSANMGILIDAMSDKRLVVRGDLLFEQMCGYRRDKETQATETFSLLHPGETATGRREKHHWDRVSALLWACHAAVQKPIRIDPRLRVESDTDNMYREDDDRRIELSYKQWAARRLKRRREERRDEKAHMKARKSVYAPKD